MPLNVTFSKPCELDACEMARALELIESGGEVSLSRDALESCHLIGLMRLDARIVGVCAVKPARASYTRSIAQKSGTELDGVTGEFGYLVTDRDCRRALAVPSVWRAASEELIRAMGTAKLYATTRADNTGVQAILRRCGFTRAGNQWPSEMNPGKFITLWVKF